MTCNGKSQKFAELPIFLYSNFGSRSGMIYTNFFSFQSFLEFWRILP